MPPKLFPIPAATRKSPGRRKAYIDHVALLRSRLLIYLYRHPLHNTAQTIEVIERAESIGEIQLLLNYVLARGRVRGPGGAGPHA